MRKLITKIRNESFPSRVVTILLAAFILRIILAHFGTLTLDQNTFIAWGRMIATNGFRSFYNGWSDYLPGYLYILTFLARIEAVWPFSLTLLYKLPAIFGDLATGYLLYEVVRKVRSARVARIAMALFLLNPALIANSTLWGQVDILTAFFALFALWLLSEDRDISSAFALAIGALIKPQAALAAPIVLLIFWNKKGSLMRVARYVGLSLAVFLAGFIPFTDILRIPSFAMERINVTISQYPYGSINAFNFWGLWGFWKQEGTGLFSIKNIGYVLFATTSLISWIRLKKEKAGQTYLFLALLLLSNFLFFTHMHERHLLPAIAALSFAAALIPSLVIPLAILSAVYVANMYYAFVWITQNFREVISTPAIVLLILLNLLSMVLIWFYPMLSIQGKRILKTIFSKKITKDTKNYVMSFWNTTQDPAIETLLSPKKIKIYLLILLAFTFITRTINLSNPTNEYFDEVYHAFTARAMYNDDKRAWEWWNENPQGFAFEWTHPPIAKEAMVVGMLLFGENSFGWRVSAAVFGTISVFLLYKIGSHLFNEEVGLVAGAAMSLDGLSLVMSRIGMNDIYVVTFILLTLYLFLKNKYLFASISLGFAAASKWSTLWFVPVLIASFVLLKRKLTPSLLWFFLIPPIIYVASYIPQFVSGHDWSIFWGMQKQMWWYHTGLVATHPYTSQWWTWPLLLRPIWLYTSGDTGGMIANIYGMGNPAIFWGGLVSVCMSLYYAFVEKRKNVLIALVGYAGLFMPWALSPRIMFFYHYFPAVPFMCLLIGFVLVKNRKAILPFLLLSLILFIYFYPHWAGIPVPLWLDASYYWLPGWR